MKLYVDKFYNIILPRKKNFINFCFLSFFFLKSNKLITYGMKRWKNRHNRFVKISKLVPKYTPKQIASQ